jgi:hypothetical protein
MSEQPNVSEQPSGPRVGLRVTHRRYVPYSHAHYSGNLVDGAYSLGLFGDVATEVCIRTDEDAASGTRTRAGRGEHRDGHRQQVHPVQRLERRRCADAGERGEDEPGR